MSEPAVSTAARGRLVRLAGVLVGVALSAWIVVIAMGSRGLQAAANLGAATGWRPHGPKLHLLGDAPLAVQLHVFTIVPAFLIGTGLMFGPKGVRLHRILGWTYVVLMAFTAVSALFIPNPGGLRFSILYLFSALTLVTLPLAVRAARRHNVAGHSRSMISLYLGGLIFAGLLAFLPGRLMWRMVFG